jgi:menaquinone-dependent protoporphyrinogen oxidase
MATVLVVHASRHGSTRGIAERIAHELERRGHVVALAAASDSPSVSGSDAVVVGSAVYMGSWLDDGLRFLRENTGVLSNRRVWVFSSGPLPASKTFDPDADPVEAALGPEVGPGSGGRVRLQDLIDVIGPREHRVFSGAFDPKDPPKAIAERLVRALPGARGILPPGDYRDWPAIDAWADSIARELPVGAMA